MALILGPLQSNVPSPRPRQYTPVELDYPLTLNEALATKRGPHFDVRAWGAVGDGDVADAIQAAYNEAALTGGTVYWPRGSYGVSRTINVHGDNPATALPVQTVFEGGENLTKVKALNDIAGPVLSCAPTQAGQQASYGFKNVYVDMQLAPSATGLYLSNLILAKVYDCKMRAGAVGFQLNRVGASDFFGNWVYNSLIGFNTLTGTGTLGNANSWVNCTYYMTGGAFGEVTAGFLDSSQQQDAYYVNCRAQRNPSAPLNMLEGFVFEDLTATANTGSVWMVNCNVDGITDGTIGLTHGGFRFKNHQHVRLDQCWASTVGTGSNKQPAVILDTCVKSKIKGSYLSGRGLNIIGVCDRIKVENNDFPTLVATDPAIRLSTATLTNFVPSGNLKYTGTAPWFDSYTVAQAAQPSANGVL